MTQLSKPAMRKDITIALASGAHFYGEHMQHQVEDNLLRLFTEALAELEAMMPEKVKGTMYHHKVDTPSFPEGMKGFVMGYENNIGWDLAMDNVHAAFAAFREEHGL